MRVLQGILVFLCFVFVPASSRLAHASENPYFPLVPGLYSPYTAGDTIDIFYNVIGTEEFYGHTVWVVMREVVWSGRHILEIYSTDTDGDVLYHGRRSVDTAGVLIDQVFNPPIRIIDMPVLVGKSWVDNTVVSRYQDGILFETEEGLTYSGRIVAIDIPIDVPAGSFSTLEIAGDWGSGATRYWFAQDIGTVRLERPGGGTESLAGPVVAIEQLSWGSVKSLYR